MKKFNTKIGEQPKWIRKNFRSTYFVSTLYKERYGSVIPTWKSSSVHCRIKNTNFKNV